jgi:hypothetical protein
MKLRTLLLGLLAGTSVIATAGAPSPARVQLDGFIAAVNSADRAKIEAFGRDHMPPDFMRTVIIDQTLHMAETTGGFDVLDVTESTPHALKGHLRERRTQNVQEITVVVDDAAPERITTIGLTGGEEVVKHSPR